MAVLGEEKGFLALQLISINGYLGPWNKWDAKKMKAEGEVQVHEARQAIHMTLFPRQAD